MQDKRKWKMVGLVALVVSIGTVTVAQDATYNNVTVSNKLTVIGPDVSSAGESRGIEGEAPIIINQGDGTSLLFTRSAAIVFTRTNETSGSVTADINGDVELTERVVSVETYRYSIYAEKLIDNNTLVDVPRAGLPSPLYRAGSGGSNSVGTILFNYTNTDPITVDSSDPEPADWSIPVDALYPPHKNEIADPMVYIRSGGTLTVHGDAIVDGTLTVGGVDVPAAIAGSADDIAALWDVSAVSTDALQSELAALSAQVNEALVEDAPVADAVISSAADVVLAGDIVSGFIGENYVIRWSSSAGAQYQIQSSADLVEWENVGLPFTGTGDTMNWANAIAESQSFYRVIVAD